MMTNIYGLVEAVDGNNSKLFIFDVTLEKPSLNCNNLYCTRKINMVLLWPYKTLHYCFIPIQSVFSTLSLPLSHSISYQSTYTNTTTYYLLLSYIFVYKCVCVNCKIQITMNSCFHKNNQNN